MANEPVTIDAAEHHELMDEWALTIGRFMVRFTSCEYWTHQYIKTLDRLREAAGELMLGARAPTAQALVLDIVFVPEVHKRVDAAFSKLNGLAKTRDLVAHNGPLIHVYRDKDDKVELMIELRSARDDGKSITIKRLDVLAAEARDLDEEFAMLSGEVRQPMNHVRG